MNVFKIHKVHSYFKLGFPKLVFSNKHKIRAYNKVCIYFWKITSKFEGFFVWLILDLVNLVKYGVRVMFLSSRLWTTLLCIYPLNMQKTFWFVSRFEHASFVVNGKYSQKNYDNPNYYASLVIFRTYKNAVPRSVHLVGWLFWLCFYPIALIHLKPWLLPLTLNNHVPIVIHIHMTQIIVSHCIKNYCRANHYS